MAQMLLKCADIGHLSVDPKTHKRWAFQLEEEFFRQVSSLYTWLTLSAQDANFHPPCLPASIPGTCPLCMYLFPTCLYEQKDYIQPDYQVDYYAEYLCCTFLSRANG